MPIFSDARPSLYSGRTSGGISGRMSEPFSDVCPGRFFGRSPSLFRTLVRGDFSDAVRALEIYIGRQSGDFLFGFGRLFFIRYRRLACIAFFVFLNEEYLIALVDFIGSLRGHQRAGTADSAEPSFPTLWTPPFPTLGNRCGGILGCRGFMPI